MAKAVDPETYLRIVEVASSNLVTSTASELGFCSSERRAEGPLGVVVPAACPIVPVALEMSSRVGWREADQQASRWAATSRSAASGTWA